MEQVIRGSDGIFAPFVKGDWGILRLVAGAQRRRAGLSIRFPEHPLSAVPDVSQDRLHPGVKVAVVAQMQLLVDGVDIILHRLGTQDQVFGDGGVVVPLGHHRQYFLLARRQAGRIPVRRLI